MITVSKQENGVLFTFQDSDKYLYGSGTIEVPFNSLSIIQDESDNITLRKSASNDIFLSARYDTDFGYASKEAAVEALKEILYDEAGISEEEVQEMIDAATSGIPSSEVVEQLRRDVNAVSGEVDTKQDILTAGDNITISGNVISAEAGNNIIELTQEEYDALVDKDPDALYIITDAQEINMNDYATKTEVDNALSGKADTSAVTAVSGTVSSLSGEIDALQGDISILSGDIDDLSRNKADESFVVALQGDVSALSGDVQTKLEISDFNAYSAATDARIAEDEEVTAAALNDLAETVSGKQDTLISGENIKTINNISILGAGNITVSGGGGGDYQYYSEDTTNESASIEVGHQSLTVDGNGVYVNGDTVVTEGYLRDYVTAEELDDNYYTQQIIDEKEEVIASALTQLNQDVADIDAKEEVIASALTEVNLTLDNKLDASAYTPTDLSNYYTKSEVYNKQEVDTVYETAYQALTAHTANTTVHVTSAEKDAWNAKADASAITSIESDITAVSNNLNTLSGAVIDNEYTVSQAINSLNNRVTAVESGGTGGGITSGEVQTMIDDSLDIYWTSAQTQTAIDAAKAYYISFATIATTGIRDEDWDGIVAAIDDHRPIYAGYPRTDGGIIYYGVECMDKNVSNTQIVLISSDNTSHYFYTFTKNGSNDYSYTVERRPYTTQTEKDAWNAKQDALSAGTGISISNNVISTSGVVMSQQVTQIVKLTQAAYDALATKDAQTLYIVVD